MSGHFLESEHHIAGLCITRTYGEADDESTTNLRRHHINLAAVVDTLQQLLAQFILALNVCINR